MKTNTLFLSLLFASFSTLSIGQIDGYLRNKANNAAWRAGRQADRQVDKKINEKVDQAVEDAFNKKDSAKNAEAGATETQQSGSSTKKSSSGSSSGGPNAMQKAMMGRLGMSTERPASLREKYDYKGNLLMSVQAWDENGETDGAMQYTTYYSEKDRSFAMEFEDKEKEEGKSRMIFDTENQIMVILSEDGQEKSGVVMAYTGASMTDTTTTAAGTSQADAGAYQDYYSNFKKTGKTKTVSGYKCEEYVYEDEESKAEYWMTNDLPKELWANMFSTNTISSVAAGKPNGFIMEWSQAEKKTKEKSTMVVKEVNKDKQASISTADYTFVTFKTPESKDKEKK